VYEQDTNKIKEAKDELEALEEERQKASIQYQIEQLEVQKQTLTALIENETSSEELLEKIEKNTSVLGIIASNADVKNSDVIAVTGQSGAEELSPEGAQ
jgi:hypothetical protein